MKLLLNDYMDLVPKPVCRPSEQFTTVLNVRYCKHLVFIITLPNANAITCVLKCN